VVLLAPIKYLFNSYCGPKADNLIENDRKWKNFRRKLREASVRRVSLLLSNSSFRLYFNWKLVNYVVRRFHFFYNLVQIFSQLQGVEIAHPLKLSSN
jgi:hypothetical protein